MIEQRRRKQEQWVWFRARPGNTRASAGRPSHLRDSTLRSSAGKPLSPDVRTAVRGVTCKRRSGRGRRRGIGTPGAARTGRGTGDPEGCCWSSPTRPDTWTGLVDRLDGPPEYRAFFETPQPHTRRVVADVAASQAVPALRSCFRGTPLVAIPGAPWGRCSTTGCGSCSRRSPWGSCWHNRGAQSLACRSGALPAAFTALEPLLHDLLNGAARALLSGERERELARVCFALALYEQCYRIAPNPSWPIVALRDADVQAVRSLCEHLLTAVVSTSYGQAGPPDKHSCPRLAILLPGLEGEQEVQLRCRDEEQRLHMRRRRAA